MPAQELFLLLTSNPTTLPLHPTEGTSSQVYAEWFTAIGTILVAIAAVWGDYLRHLVAGPKLHLKMEKPEGLLVEHPIQIPMTQGPPRASTKVVRHYHLQLEDRRRWAVATKVAVRIQRMAVQAHANLEYNELPLLFPIHLNYVFADTVAYKDEGKPNIGASTTCDLLCIGESGVPKLILRLKPESFADTLDANLNYKIAIQAVGENGSSNVMIFKIQWNGRWNTGDSEMAKNLSISQLSKWNEQ